MVNQSLDEQRQWAESEVERLEANLQNLLSLNASDIGKQMAREELDAAKSRLAELRGEAAPAAAVEETAPEPAETSSEPAEEAASEPAEVEPETSPVESAEQIASDPVEEQPVAAEEPAAEEAEESAADSASDPTEE